MPIRIISILGALFRSQVLLTILPVILAARPAAAMTEFCMQDGADVKATFFAAPTKDTTSVRIVMAGYTYSIPRNYFRFPQVECRTGETRGMVLRMTLPDFLPATKETWDRLYGKSAGFVQVGASPQTIKEMARLLKIHSDREIEGHSAPPTDGLSSLVQGPLDQGGYPVSDVYYAPSRQKPRVIIYCTPNGKYAGSGCDFLFSHNELVWRPWMRRKDLPHWREIIDGLKRKIDSFVVQRPEGG